MFANIFINSWFINQFIGQGQDTPYLQTFTVQKDRTKLLPQGSYDRVFYFVITTVVLAVRRLLMVLLGFVLILRFLVIVDFIIATVMFLVRLLVVMIFLLLVFIILVLEMRKVFSIR